MNEHNSLRYLVDSKRGAIWVSVDDAPWSVESTVADNPKQYFNTLKAKTTISKKAIKAETTCITVIPGGKKVNA